MFAADLVRAIHQGCDNPPRVYVEFIRASSYGNERDSSGEVKIRLDTDHPLQGRNVLLVEDIVDTGVTINFLLSLYALRYPATLELVTLLDKQGRRKIEVPIAMSGFKIPPVFVIGYGLDDQGACRDWPYIATDEAGALSVAPAA